MAARYGSSGIAAARGLDEGTIMRNLMWVGVLLVILGIAGLVIQNFTYKEDKTVLNVGPLQLTAEEQHRVPIPTIAGIVAVIAGLGMVVMARRAT